MKAKDIEKEMRRIAEEGKELQAKLEIIEALKGCHDNNHDYYTIEKDIAFASAQHVTYECANCMAAIIIGSKHHTHEIDGKWRWYKGPFEGLTVEEVYEIEDTDPLPEPQHPYSTPSMREKEIGASYELKTESDGKGGYRTKMVPTGSEGDANESDEVREV